MSSGSELPDEIYQAAEVIRELRDKDNPTRAEREILNRAKLRVAFWACRSESIVASRENLTYILGPDASAIMGAYDKYLEREDVREAEQRAEEARRRRRRGDKTQFWESV